MVNAFWSLYCVIPNVRYFVVFTLTPFNECNIGIPNKLLNQKLWTRKKNTSWVFLNKYLWGGKRHRGTTMHRNDSLTSTSTRRQLAFNISLPFHSVIPPSYLLLVFYCCFGNHYKFIASNSMLQFCMSEVLYYSKQAKVKVSASCIHFLIFWGKIQFHMVVGLRAPFSCWLWAERCFQHLDVPCIFWHTIRFLHFKASNSGSCASPTALLWRTLLPSSPL